MSFLVYFFVLLVAVSSVLFGLDWMQAPLQPPARERTAISAPVQAAPAETTAAATTNANPAPVASNANPAPVASPTPLTGAPAGEIATTEGLKAEGTENKPAPLCDVSACERAYHSFTAVDCTYQPSWGPRRLCTRGRRPSAQTTAKEANAQGRCNISACESAYQSFDAATCTYQTYGGGRRVCTK